MLLKQLIATSQKTLKEKSLDPNVIFLILLDLYSCSKSQLILKYDENINDDLYNQFIKIFNEYLLNQIPIQYLLGYTYFYHNKIMVNKNVLIPRSETEELVELAENLINKEKYKDVLDLCTGSGCIAIAIAKDEKINVTASDISKKALKVAKINALNNNVDITFLQGDLLLPSIKNELTYDLIVCNPPYIKYDSMDVDLLVKNNEPSLALYAKDNGLYYYKKIIKNLKKVLRSNGQIIFEIGFDQKEDLENYLKKFLYDYSIINDLSGNPRILKIKI